MRRLSCDWTTACLPSRLSSSGKAAAYHIYRPVGTPTTVPILYQRKQGLAGALRNDYLPSPCSSWTWPWRYATSGLLASCPVVACSTREADSASDAMLASTTYRNSMPTATDAIPTVSRPSPAMSSPQRSNGRLENTYVL